MPVCSSGTREKVLMAGAARERAESGNPPFSEPQFPYLQSRGAGCLNVVQELGGARTQQTPGPLPHLL